MQNYFVHVYLKFVFIVLFMPFLTILKARGPKLQRISKYSKQSSRLKNDHKNTEKNYYLKDDSNAQILLKNLDAKAGKYCTGAKKIIRNIPLKGAYKDIALPSLYLMPTIFFNRNSDTLIIAGPGINKRKENMACFVEIFNQYDVLVFDYRWAANFGYKLYPQTVKNPVNAMLLDEVEEIESIVAYAKTLKNYKKIIGLGECYSTYLMVLAQQKAMQNGYRLFSKLILDSCWLSMNAFADAICNDPFLPLTGCKGGSPVWFKSFFNFIGFGWIVKKVTNYFWSTIDVRSVLADISQTPILFIHGQNDLLVPKLDFEQILEAARQNPTSAILTPYTHSANVHDRHIYKFLCESFIEQNFADFTQALKNLV